MSKVYPDLARDTTSTAGTGDLTMDNTPPSGYQAVTTSVGVGNTTDYRIADSVGNWEVGLGNILNSTTMQRVRVFRSSNGNALVNFPAGSKDVVCTVSGRSFQAAATDCAIGLTAAGTDQATALALTSEINFVSTVAAGSGVRLPPGVKDDLKWVANHGANTLNLYPATGETVENLAVNIPLPLLPGQTYKASCTVDGVWDGFEIGAYDDENKCLIMHTNSTDPTAPPAGAIRLFGRSIAQSKATLAIKGASGIQSYLQAAIWQKSIGIWEPPGNSTTVPGVFGMVAPTAVGTATARNVATTNVMSRALRLGYVSATTAGSLAGHYIAQAQHTTGTGTGAGFLFAYQFAASDAATVSGARQFVGVSNNVSAPTNVEPSTLTNSIGIAQLSTSSTQLYLVYGGSAAQTPIALGVNFPPAANGTTSGHLYNLMLFSPPNENGTCYYQVDNLSNGSTVSGAFTVTTPGTQLPSNTTLLAPRAWRCNNATALAVGLDIAGIYRELP